MINVQFVEYKLSEDRVLETFKILRILNSIC